MAEYIEREALMRNLKHFAPEQLTPLIESLIQKQPAADVVEVRRERWDYENSDVGGADYSCSACRNIITVSSESQDEDLYSYCPYCGAKMDGKGGTDT